MTDIELQVGQTYTTVLPGRGSAGYGWEYVTEGSAEAVDIATSRSAVSANATPGGPPPDNANADEVVTIRGQKPGRVQIRLALRRPWERDQPPLEERILQVTVRD